MTAAELEALFAADGALAQAIPDYAPRREQTRMAQSVSVALERQQNLVVEAGTGTGKTFAYLVPALMSGLRVLVSTGTLNLQDQLFLRDLPRLRAALGAPVGVALLKGRVNYLCRHRLQQAVAHPGLRAELPRLRRLDEWMQQTVTGEIQQAEVLQRDDPLLPRVTSTAENCLGSKCAEIERCFVAKARQRAQAADLVVVNHHLLLSDFVLKEEGFGRLLPGVDAVIVDEAHQMPEVAESFFGVKLSSHQLDTLAQDALGEAQRLADVPDLIAAALETARVVSQLAAALASAPTRMRYAEWMAQRQPQAVLDAVATQLAQLSAQLKSLAERGPELETLHGRARDLSARLNLLCDESTDQVRWVDCQARGGSLHATPLKLDADFRRLRASVAGSWIHTSATLAVGDDFSHFLSEMGLDSENEEVATLRLDSPFDYETQARLYLPPGLPEPNAADYHERLFDAVLPLIRESGGGAFLLCTSHRALRLAAARLRKDLKLPLFVQGEGDRAALLERFAQDGNGVLIGTSSFWEGVDVRGSALRLVIIDRLPFTAPGDPVYEARMQSLERQGKRPFWEYQLPQAIMALRQGAGRLIRDAGDRGLLVLCDPRLRSKSYGARVLASLPPMPVLEDAADARAWLRKIRP